MKTGFKKLSKEDLVIMGEILSDAFSEHENFKYLIESKKRRKKATSYLFRSMMSVINKYGYIYSVYHKDDVIGYITFMDDNSYKMNAFTISRASGLVNMLRFVLYLRFKEIMRYLQYLKTYNQFDHKKEGYIHLYMTGIKKECKGKGFMGQALRDTFLHFKQKGYKGVVLETSDSSNISLYEYLGFKVVNKISTKNNEQTIYFFEKDF